MQLDAAGSGATFAGAYTAEVFTRDQVDELLHEQFLQLEQAYEQQLKRMIQQQKIEDNASFSRQSHHMTLGDAKRIAGFLKRRSEQELRMEQLICQSLESASQQQRQLNDSLSKEQEKCRRIAEALKSVASSQGLALPAPIENLLTASPSMIFPPCPVPTSIFGDREQFLAEITWLEAVVRQEAAGAAPAAQSSNIIIDQVQAGDEQLDADAMMVDTPDGDSSPLVCEESLDALFETQETILDSNSAFFHVPEADVPFSSRGFFSPPVKASAVPARVHAMSTRQKIPTIIVTPPHEAPPPRRRQSTGKAAAAAAAIAALPSKNGSTTQLDRSQQDQEAGKKIRRLSHANHKIAVATTAGATISVKKKPGTTAASNARKLADKSSPSSPRLAESDLFAQNLPEGVTAALIQQFFERADAQVTGFVQGVNGTGFITFPTLEQASRALVKCHMATLGDRRVHLSLDKK